MSTFNKIYSRYNIKIILTLYIVTFIFYFIFYIFAGHREHVPNYMLSLQIFYFFIYTIALHISTLHIKNNKILYCFIFLYVLFSSCLVRWVSWVYLNEPFLNAIDSVNYDYFAERARSQDMSFSSYVILLLSDIFKYDDLGMFLIAYLTYSFANSNIVGQNLLLILNAFVVTAISVRINKTMMLYGVRDYCRRFCLIAFTCFPFLSLTAAVGLKENFFILIMVSYLYTLTRYKEKGGFGLIILAFVYSLLAFLFRGLTGFSMIICCFVSYFSSFRHRKLMIYLIFIGLIIGLLGINIVLMHLYGITLENIFATTEYRSQNMSSMGDVTKWVVNSLAFICGPFPNFSRSAEYAIVHSPGLIIKILLNFSLILGLFNVIRNYDYKKYHIVVFFLIDAVTLILAGVALDMRYHITLFPVALPLIAITILKIKFNHYFIGYFLLAFILIFFYNNR